MYTLAEMMDSGIVPGIKQITNCYNLSQTNVSSVCIQELPAGDFIRKDEAVLSTASGCLDDPEAFKSLIKWVHDSKGSALLLSFEDPDYIIDDSVLSYALKVKLPVFTIPWDIRFSSIQSAVNAAINNKLHFKLEQLQSQLFNAFFESKPLEDAAAYISTSLKADIGIYDPDDEQLCMSLYTSNDRKTDRPVEDAGYGYLSERKFDIKLSRTSYGYINIKFTDESDEYNMITSLGANETEKYICFPLSLWFNKRNIEYLTKLKLKNDFLWNLSTDNFESLTEMVRQGKMLGFDITKPYVCIVMKAVPRDMDIYIENYSVSNAAALSNEFENMLIKEGRSWPGAAMVSGRDLEFIIYLQVSQALYKNTGGWIDKLYDKFIHRFRAYEFYFGISNKSDAMPVFSELYKNALQALNYCMHLSGNIHRFTYEDTRESRIIKLLSDNKDMLKIASELISPLTVEHNPGINLIETMCTYIKSNYNTSLTARKLNIHRQSLLYRLEKIESLSHISLSSHQDLFLMELSLRVLSYY